MLSSDHLSDLSDLECTIGSLIIDLLQAPDVHSELILSPPVNNRGEHSSDAVRLTLHYTSALLAYGLSEKTGQIERAKGWFATPFTQGTRLTPTEMNRLEALLMLTPSADEYVQPRLAQLAQQRRKQSGTFFLHSTRGARTHPFDTLWALKILSLAHHHHILNGIWDTKSLKQTANRVVGDVFQDKDLALALRLRCEHYNNRLNKKQRALLSSLLKNAEDNNGIWGEPHGIKHIITRMEHHDLSPGDVAEDRDIFREVILSTCYVIENLALLREHFPEIQGALNRAIELWWHVFAGEDAINRLRAIFPKPYDYLFIVSRTFVALRNYLGQDLKEWGEPYVHNQLAKHVSENKVTTPENQNIKKALKDWIKVELSEEPKALRLGMSSSNIVRIKPYVANPLYPDDPNLRLSFPDTLIVKYGPIDEIEAERKNYAQLPSTLKADFVNIPEQTYIDEKKQCAYIIMPDLRQYQTLHERLHMGPPPESLATELAPFLISIYARSAAVGQSRAQRGAIRRLYLAPMLDNLDRIFNYMAEIHAFIPEKDPTESENLHATLHNQIGQLMQRAIQLQTFTTTCMHGDLHSRNIMLRRTKRREGNDFLFKLIDLEKFERDGDFALDAGQLLIDLEILRKNFGDRAGPISTMMDCIEQAFFDYAEELNDAYFHIRLHIAQARALIRIAKGLVKQGEQMLSESRRSPAVRLADEVVEHAQLASGFLDNSLEGLANGGSSKA